MHASQLRVRRRVLGRLVLGRLFPGEGDHEAAAGAPRVHLDLLRLRREPRVLRLQ